MREKSSAFFDLLLDIVSDASGTDAVFFPTHRAFAMECRRTIVRIYSIHFPCGMGFFVHVMCSFNQEDTLTSVAGILHINCSIFLAS